MNRRRYLQMLVGTGALAGLAGCNDSTESDTPSPTVVFTDESTASSETPITTSETPSSAPTPEPTATGTATPTPTETATPKDRVFDGGDLESFVDAVMTAAEIGGGTVVVEPNTYRFEPLQGGGANWHALLQSVENVTIEGNGATFVLTNPSIGGFRFIGGSDITIRDLILDYDPVPFTQGRLETVLSDDGTLTLTLDEGYPTLDHSIFQRADSVYAMVHEPDGQFFSGVRANGPPEKYFSDIKHTGGRAYRFSLDSNSNFRGLAEGRRLTVVARNNGAVLSMYKTENPNFENVTIRTASGADFSVQVCESPTFRDCTVAPPPNSDRQLSSVADGIRITNCLERSTVENCYHDSLGDDSVAVDNRMTTIRRFQDDRTVEVKEIHPFVVKAGDSLEALSPTGVRKTDLPPVESVQGPSASVGDRVKPITITFEEPVREALAEGDFLGNTATNSENYTIRNNEFRNHRANLIRAVLVAVSSRTISSLAHISVRSNYIAEPLGTGRQRVVSGT
ncbi:hypothetical protein [Halovenus salina]|uniref:Uncharacterized protein n=2 Tax=Halovenus salina TaxID=1510225 RepID=A0ABD5W3T7_9EURY